MTDAERLRLIDDLNVLSATAWSVIPTAEGVQLEQLLEVVERSDSAVRELQAGQLKWPASVHSAVPSQVHES